MSGNYPAGKVVIQKRGDTDLTDDWAEALEFTIASAEDPNGISINAKVEFAVNSEAGGRTLVLELRGISPAEASAIDEAGYVRLDGGTSDGGIGPVFFGKVRDSSYRFDSGKLTYTYSATDQGEFYALRPAISDPNSITIGEALTRCYEGVGARDYAIRGLAIPEIAFGSDSDALYAAVAGKPQPDATALLNAVTLANGYTATKTFIEEIRMLCQELAKRLTDLYGRAIDFYPIMQKDGFSLYIVDPTLFTTEPAILLDVTQPNVQTAHPSKGKGSLNYEALGLTGAEDVQDQTNVQGSTTSVQEYEVTCDLESALDLGVKVGVSEGAFNRLALFTVESGTHTIATGQPFRTSVKGRMAEVGYIEVPSG